MNNRERLEKAKRIVNITGVVLFVVFYMAYSRYIPRRR